MGDSVGIGEIGEVGVGAALGLFEGIAGLGLIPEGEEVGASEGSKDDPVGLLVGGSLGIGEILKNGEVGVGAALGVLEGL